MHRKVIAGVGLICGLAGAGMMAAETTSAASSENENPATESPVRITPAYLTLRDEPANIDSLAAWHDGHGRHWLLATAKAGNAVRVYNADDGAPIAAMGQNDGVELARPNGIAVAGDMAFVVERDNARVTVLALPSLRSIGTFGADHLRRPYGIWIGPADDSGRYSVAITDDYVNPDDSRPTGDALDHRLQQFKVARHDDAIAADWIKATGPTSGRGTLHKVESIAGDPTHDRLLVADESPSARDIKIFDLTGDFTGQTIGHGLFEHDPEGIALVTCGGGSGYWITTDQSDEANRFQVFGRTDLVYRGAFTSPAITNTDGIAVTQTAMPHFPQGAFFALNDDGNVAAIDLTSVTEALSPPACRTASHQ